MSCLFNRCSSTWGEMSPLLLGPLRISSLIHYFSEVLFIFRPKTDYFLEKKYCPYLGIMT